MGFPLVMPPLLLSRFHKALLFSLLIHGLLLITGHWPVARWNSFSAGSLDVYLSGPALPPDPKTSPGKQTQREVDKPSHKQLAAHGASVNEQKVLASPLGESVLMAVSPALSEMDAGGKAATQGTASLQPARNPDGETIQGYRLKLLTQAKRFRVYPVLARQRHWEGRVDLVLEHIPGASSSVLRLRRTSGFEILDQQAIWMLQQAMSVVPLPLALRDQGFQISMPVDYRVEDE